MFFLQFIQKRKMAYIVSAVLVGVGLFSLISRGLDLGVEFTGGRTYVVEFQGESAPDRDAVETQLGEAFADEEIEMTIMRDGAEQTISMQVDTAGKLGIALDAKVSDVYAMQPYQLGNSLKFGFKDAVNTLVLQVLGFAKLFAGEVNPRDSVASPIGIAKLFGATWDWGRFWLMTALISMVLAFMNFLPIPALDGGHIVFLMIEIVRGKPVSEKVLEKAQMVGMILLLMLMAFAVGNDILKGFGI
jgi:regulator of sigma E protease